MKRISCWATLLCGATLLMSACADKVVKTTSIALTITLREPFNLAYVDAVEIYLGAADRAEADQLFNPEVQASQTVEYGGRTVQVEAGDFLPDDGGLRESRLRIAGNPFARVGSGPPTYEIVVQSKAAASKPVRVVVRVLRGEAVIASGTATRTVEQTPIITVTDEKRRVEVSVACAPGFACDTGNRGPMLAPFVAQNLVEGETRTIDLQATDPDGHAVDYRLEGAPRFVTLDQQARRITIAPGFGDSGSYPDVKVVATDQGTPPLSVTQSLIIEVSNTNRKPMLSVVEVSPVGSERCSNAGGMLSCSLTEGTAFTLSVAVSDDPEDTIASLDVSPKPIGSAFVVGPDRKSATFSWLTTYDQGAASSTSLVFTVSDNNGGQSAATVPVTVQDVNRDPIVTLTEAQTLSPRCGTTLPLQCSVPEGYTLTLNLLVSDDTGESIDTLVMTGPQGLTPPATFSPASDNHSGLFTFRPDFATASSTPYEFEFEAGDDKGGLTRVKAIVTVTNVNRPPAIEIQAPPMSSCADTDGVLRCSVEEGVNLSFDLAVADPDPDDAITLLSMEQPTGLGAGFVVRDATNTAGSFTWTPTFQQAGGPYQITFSAQDSTGASVQKQVEVTVVQVNQSPTIAVGSGLVGSVAACKGTPLVCYVDFVAGGDSTLVLQLDVRDADTPRENLTLEMSAPDLPQIGPGFEPSLGIFTFTAQDSFPAEYPVTFTVRDNDPTQPKSARLDITLRVNAPNKAPTVTLGSCPTTVQAGQVIVCTAQIDDPDPRDAPLELRTTTVAGGSFSYDMQARRGTFTLAPTVTQSGTFQVDFIGTDSRGASSIEPYTFKVDSPPIARLLSIPIDTGVVLDLAFKPPYLYATRNGFLSIFDASNPGSVQLVKEIAVRSEFLRVDEQRGLLLVTAGRSLYFYDIAAAPGTPALVAKLNLIGANRYYDDVAIRTLSSGPLSGNTYVLAAHSTWDSAPTCGVNGQLDLIRVESCSDGTGTLCPVRIASLMGVLPEDPPALCHPSQMGMRILGDSLLVMTGSRGIRQVSFADERLTVLSGTNQVFDGPEGEQVVPSIWFGASPGGSGHRLSIPFNLSPNSGLALFDIDAAGTMGGPTWLRTDAAARASARIGGYNVATFADGLRVYDDNALVVGSVTDTAANFGLVLPGGNLVFAATDYLTSFGNPTNVLSVFEIDSGGALTPRQEILNTVNEPVRGSAGYSLSASQTLFYAIRIDFTTGTTPIEIYDISSPPQAPRVHRFGDPALFVLRLRPQGRYLVGHAALNDGRRQLAVYDLGVSALSPPEVSPVGFELPLWSEADKISLAATFGDASGRQFVYLVGPLCVPDCATGTKTHGTWLVELTPTGLALPRQTPVVDLPPSGAGLRFPVARGTALYVAGLAADGQSSALKVVDISNPAEPQMRSDLTIELADIPGDTNAVLALLGETLLWTWSVPNGGPGGAVLFSIDPNDPFTLRRRGRVVGAGSVVSGGLYSATRALLNTDFGLLRVDISDLDRPRIDGGQEGVAFTHILGNRLIRSSTTGAKVWELLP